MNILRKKLENKEKIYGSLVSLTDPALCEIMGNVGYDCVWIDTEHTYMSYKEVFCHLNAARSAGIPAVVRVPQDDLTFTKKILDMGPDGIIFPMVRSAEELERVLDMTLYPPIGSRGFGPLRAIAWGAEDAKEYVDGKYLEMLRFVQIEHIGIIEDIEKVAKNPYVDGFIFGPNDLSASLGEFLEVFEDATVSKIKYATEVLRREGKIVGLAGGASNRELEFWSEMGFDMLFAGADWCFVYAAGKNTLETMKKYGESK